MRVDRLLSLNHRMTMVYILTAVLIGMLFGCATMQPKSPETVLTDRVQRLWNAKLAEDRKTVYKMLDAKYRQTTSLETYLQKNKYGIKSFSIHRIKMAQDGQSAHVVMVYEGIVLARMLKLSVGERWVLENGQWHLKLSDPVNPFSNPSPKVKP